MPPVLARKIFDNHEALRSTDETEVLREYQTEAQAKIQALKAKGRSKKLRQKLELLTNSALIAPERLTHKDEISIISLLKEYNKTEPMTKTLSPSSSIEPDLDLENISLVSAVNEGSAIERQMTFMSNKTPSLTKAHQPKWSLLKALGLKGINSDH